ncbi:MAG: hypothetical protein IJ816_00790 [Alloprevotella sp.]|nr:hypothetical protein [Alloprevotella sp.]
MNLSRLFVIAIFGALVISCSSKEEGKDLKYPSTKEVTALYKLATSEKYEDITKKMASCKDMPAEYVEEIQNALKQHAFAIRENKGGIRDFSINDIEAFSDKGEYATDALISVIYNDSTEEEVLFRMVFEDGKWFLR